MLVYVMYLSLAVKMVGKALDKNEEELFFKFAGLNHFHWHRVWDVDGTELTDKAIQKLYVENDGLRKIWG